MVLREKSQSKEEFCILVIFYLGANLSLKNCTFSICSYGTGLMWNHATQNGFFLFLGLCLIINISDGLDITS